jgi:hypothetical protein
MAEGALVFSSDRRERTTSVQINEAVSVNYKVKQITGQPVDQITGSILKSGERVGGLNWERSSDQCYISLEKYSTLTDEERRAIAAKVLADMNSIQTTPIE